MLIESKMYCTNWVFLRSSQNDKDALLKLQHVDYNALKQKLNSYKVQWCQRVPGDSLANVFAGFEQLLSKEKEITRTLVKFEDYDDPMIKMEAERVVEDEVLPRTAALIQSLKAVIYKMQIHKNEQEAMLKYSSRHLRMLILTLSIITACTGYFLSSYMTNNIIRPLNRIQHIVNDLGKGIIRKLEYRKSKDEIGEMVNSVNNLSEKLFTTATFAHEVGVRNFDMPFQPLSGEDMLGKALISMRDNLKASEEELHTINLHLLQRNKELEEFAFAVSHDLRAPVANIIGFTHALNALGKDVDKKQRDMLNALSTSAEKLDKIVIDLNRVLQQRRQND